MAAKRVVHYLNQFFGGLGGEDRADAGVSAKPGPVGPGTALQACFGKEAEVVATLMCGDNHVNERREEALAALKTHLTELKPDLLVAGPAFNAGRYGVACVEVCRLAASIGILAVTGMHPRAPAAIGQRGTVLVWPTAGNAAGMKPALDGMAALGKKLLRGEALGAAEVEGYLPRGDRRNHDRGRSGAERALDMLLAKLHGRPFVTEVPINVPERVPPAHALADLSRAKIALVTTGGLVLKGNPDRQVSFNATRFHRHTVTELQSLSGRDWEAYHAGYFNHIANTNPNYILPLSFMRDVEARGLIGGVYESIYALPGVSTPVDTARQLGREIAADLVRGGVDGALLVAT
jgi:glycine reductase